MTRDRATDDDAQPAPPRPGDPSSSLLLLGATSLVGRFLTPRSPEVAARVTALSRGPRPAYAPAGVGWVRGDLAAPDLGLAGNGLGRVDAVVSLSPIWLLPPVLPALIERGARRVVAFSSTSRLTKQASPVAAERRVAARLAEAEALTAALCEAAGAAWTILRPTLIYAEGRDGNVSRLAGLIRRFGVLPLSGRGRGLRQPVHAADLATAALAVLDRPATFDRTFDLPGGETLDYRTMVERVFEGLDRRARIIALPPVVFRAALGLAAPLLPGATTAMGERMASDLVFDPGPAARAFGWAPRDFHPRFRRLDLP